MDTSQPQPQAAQPAPLARDEIQVQLLRRQRALAYRESLRWEPQRPPGDRAMAQARASWERWLATEIHITEHAVSELLMREWRYEVRKRSPGRSDQVIEDRLQEALAHGWTVSASTGLVRIMAPPGNTNPKAWRRQVAKNHVVSQIRKQVTRELAQDIARDGLGSDTAKAIRSKHKETLEKEGARIFEIDAEAVPTASVAPTRTLHAVLAEGYSGPARRRLLLELASALPIRRRVALLLKAHADPCFLAAPLARALREPEAAVRARLEAAVDGGWDELDCTRALYPTQALAKAQEAHRKQLERGLERLEQLAPTWQLEASLLAIGPRDALLEATAVLDPLNQAACRMTLRRPPASSIEVLAEALGEKTASVHKRVEAARSVTWRPDACVRVLFDPRRVDVQPHEVALKFDKNDKLGPACGRYAALVEHSKARLAFVMRRAR